MITTICYNGMPGVSAVFKNMEKLGISKHLPMETISELSQISGDTVIFGAFQPEYMLLIKLLRNQTHFGKFNIGFIWTSSPSETELQQVEIPFLNHILGLHQSGQIDFIWFLKPDFLELYNDLPCAFHAPAPLPELEFRVPEHKKKYDKKVLSLFLPNTLKKNIYAQFLAALAAKKRETTIQIRTNTGIKHPNVVSVGWMPQEQYKKEIEDTYLSMHVSHAESNGYGAYEILGRGIPTLISPTLARNFEVEKYGASNWKGLVVKDPDSVSEMVEKILNLTTAEEYFYKDLSNSIYRDMVHLREHNNSMLVAEFNNNGLSK